MVIIFYRRELAGDRIGGLEGRSGKHGEFYYPGQLFADGSVADGRNFLAFVDINFIDSEGATLDCRNNDICVFAAVWTRVTFERRIDVRFVSFVGSVYLQSQTTEIGRGRKNRAGKIIPFCVIFS